MEYINLRNGLSALVLMIINGKKHISFNDKRTLEKAFGNVVLLFFGQRVFWPHQHMIVMWKKQRKFCNVT